MRRVGRVVEAVLIAFGEQIGDQPLIEMLRERHEGVARLGGAAGGEREALEADHRVAAPVGEPVIPRNDAARILAGGFCPRGVGRARGRLDHELIGGEHEFGSQALRIRIAGGDEQARAAVELGLPRLIRRQGVDDAEALCRGDEGDLLVFGEIDFVVAGAPRAAVRCVAALLFQLVVKAFRHGLNGERRRMIADREPDRRHRLSGVHLEAPLMRDEHRFLRHGAIDRRFVHANRDHRAQPEANRLGRLHERVGDEDRILLVGHEQALLEHDLVERVAPHRQTADEPEVAHDHRRRFIATA